MATQSESFDTAQQTEQSAIQRANKREDARNKLAIYYICGYLTLVAALVLLASFAQLSTDATKDFLLAIGSPLGFIIGFYFKSNDSSLNQA